MTTFVDQTLRVRYFLLHKLTDTVLMCLHDKLFFTFESAQYKTYIPYALKTAVFNKLLNRP